MLQFLSSSLSKILSLKNIYTIIFSTGLLQTFQWMSRDAYVPHLFLSTSTGGSSPCSATEGAGSDLAVNVGICLTPNGCLILLASRSVHQAADLLVPAPGRAAAIPMP